MKRILAALALTFFVASLAIATSTSKSPIRDDPGTERIRTAGGSVDTGTSTWTSSTFDCNGRTLLTTEIGFVGVGESLGCKLFVLVSLTGNVWKWIDSTNLIESADSLNGADCLIQTDVSGWTKFRYFLRRDGVNDLDTTGLGAGTAKINSFTIQRVLF